MAQKYNYNKDNERCWDCGSKEMEAYDFPHYKCKECGELQHMESSIISGFFTNEQWEEYKILPEEEQIKIYQKLSRRQHE